MILRVIVPTLQIVETSLGIIVISTISERVDLGQIALRRDYLAPRGIDIFCLHDAICINNLDDVTLQVEDIVICLKVAAVNGIIKGERAAGIIVEKVQRFCAQNRPADVLPDRFPCNFSVLRQVLMRHGLGRGKRPVGFGQARLRGNRLFRRGRVRIWLDRLPRLILQRNKDQWEQEFCLVQEITSLGYLGPAKDESFIFSRYLLILSNRRNRSRRGFLQYRLAARRRYSPFENFSPPFFPDKRRGTGHPGCGHPRPGDRPPRRSS